MATYEELKQREADLEAQIKALQVEQSKVRSEINSFEIAAVFNEHSLNVGDKLMITSNVRSHIERRAYKDHTTHVLVHYPIGGVLTLKKESVAGWLFAEYQPRAGIAFPLDLILEMRQAYLDQRDNR